MSLVYNFCGVHNTPTTALRLVVKADANADLTAVVDGTTYTGDSIDTSVRDGIGRVDITGLSPDTLYDIDIYLDGVFEKATKGKTLPTDHCRIGFASCLANAGYQIWAEYFRTRATVDLIHFAGDFNYEDNTAQRLGQTSVSGAITNCLNIADRYQRIENEFILPEIQRLLDTGVQFSYMWDDHEIFNSWQFDVNEADMQILRHPGTITSAPTLDQLYDIWTAHDPYRKAIHYGNPDPPSLTGDIAQGATTATGASTDDFDPIFYEFEIPGLLTFYVLDQESHSSNDADADNGSQDPITKTTLGATQRNWLLTNGAADDNPYKFVLTSKYFWGLGNEESINADRWVRFPSERAAIATDIRDNWSNCTVLLAGDVHIGNVAAEDGLHCFCLCPCGVGNVRRETPFGDNTKRVWGRGNVANNYQVVGVIDVNEERCTIAVHDVLRQRAFRPHVFTPDGNDVVPQPAALA